ncbi:heme ABC exporter ATP-binding protein CcmA [Bacillus sp. ISL-45]|uniref:heme ABC exporter ATP-binding protein CcmA n=1 Tax=Bacillus sp. ISL-45 TaxID=2819128 RepID=UPI001BE7B0BF|nr:heme ABC exporter ATP-binding protein CcmA [Bacillus sp. ISL-45]MBT2662237.1 heme ABC exporter ATP-binding protein CcmA [Bacillus sp. ISL-45]
MLELRKMTKMLGDKLVLRNITLSLEKGEILAVIGPNGAGKSTFFKCTVGLLQPTSGEILLDGKLVKKNTAEIKQRIGFLGHESFLYNNLSPLENLKFYGKLYKVTELDRKANELLKEVGLYLFRNMPIRSFSRGMMQRLAIARVLLPNPDILMLDEPHTGLDQEAVGLLNQIIKQKRDSGTSILIISHDFEQVHALTDRAAVLKKGKIVSTKHLGEEVTLAEMKTWYEAEVKSS